MKISIIGSSIFIVSGLCASAVSALNITPKRVEYKEEFRVCGLLDGKKMVITEPFSSMRGWSARFNNRDNPGKLWAGLWRTETDAISPAVIRNVKYTVRTESSSFEFKVADFPAKSRTGIYFGWGTVLTVPANKDCMDIEVGLTLDDWGKQVKPVNEYLDAHPETIGYLNEKDLNELQDLRQTEMKFYADENENELVLTSVVDLHAMAQLSHYIRGLLRFNRANDGTLICPKSEKMICPYFNEETIKDLVAIAHNRQFKRSDFVTKSMDYLIRMGHISQLFDIIPLKLMIADCIFIKAIKSQNSLDTDSLAEAIEYSLKFRDSLLFKKLWQIVDLLKIPKNSENYRRLRELLSSKGDETMSTIADVIEGL